MFQSNLTKLLIIRNINFSDLEKKIGVTSSQLSKYARGISSPSTKTLDLLSKYFDIKPSDLLTKEITPDNYESFLISKVDKPAIVNDSLPVYPAKKLRWNLPSVGETPAERLREVFELLELGGSSAVHKASGIAQSHISDMLLGKKNVSTRMEDWLFEVHGISIHFLRYGLFPVLKGNKHNMNLDFSEFPLVPVFQSSLYSRGIKKPMNELPETATEFISFPGAERAEFALPAFSDSMKGKYEQGDILFFREVHDFALIEWGRCHLVVTEGDRYLKYVRRNKENPDLVTLQSENKALDDMTLPTAKIVKLFKVLGFLRRE